MHTDHFCQILSTASTFKRYGLTRIVHFCASLQHLWNITIWVVHRLTVCIISTLSEADSTDRTDMMSQ